MPFEVQYLETNIAQNLAFSGSVSTVKLLIQKIFFQELAKTTKLHVKILWFYHNFCTPSKKSQPVRSVGILRVCLVANFFQ